MRLSFAFNTPLSRGLLLVGIGAAFIALSWMSILLERQYQREGRTVDGVVLTKTYAIRRATRRNSDIGSPPEERETKTQYTVTYQLTAADGRTYEGRQDVAESVWNGSSPPNPAL